MKIEFSKLKLGDILCSDFSQLQTNNTLDFSRHNICVIYGPNGTGKTTLTRILKNDSDDSEYTLSIDSSVYTQEDDTQFHIIDDQNSRNIIVGSTEDFILGDNIKREYELKKNIEDGFESLFKNIIPNGLKTSFGIAKTSTYFDELILNTELRTIISDIANSRSKGKKTDRGHFLNVIGSLVSEIDENDYPKMQSFINDYKLDESIIRKFLSLSFESFTKENQYTKIEECAEALRILEKYDYMNECIVCDSPIDRNELLSKKRTQQNCAISSLSPQSKDIMEQLLHTTQSDDQFEICAHLEKSLKTGSTDELLVIVSEIARYKKRYNSLIIDFFIDSVKNTNLAEEYTEYSTLTIGKAEFEGEDIIFIESFLNDCLNRKIRLERDTDKNLHLLLGNEEFLNHPRDKLCLSNGEQNFLSLAFELLKAKKSTKKIVILDDPISSFDSIYKNKIAFAIIKVLTSKKTIVLTHNTDLIKLFEHQKQNCFSLFQLNNVEGGENGFIPISRDEVSLLLYIHEFLNLLRGNIATEILDEQKFLISIIPYMRGYCHIINDTDTIKKLNKLMHGYESEAINVTEIYNKLFSDQVISNIYTISAIDIMQSDISSFQILKADRYPLLNRTLHHTLSYLFLRLSVEKTLVKKYHINTASNEMLSQIISTSFKSDTPEEIKHRVFFLSRKTLLNEFNHFEMDMSIFQPAIDITNQTLAKEKDEIMNYLVQFQ